MAFHSTPRENSEKPVDFLNPIEIAKYGVTKSVEALRWMLGLKKDRMETLHPTEAKSREQLAVTKESVERRKDLADSIEPVEGLTVAA